MHGATGTHSIISPADGRVVAVRPLADRAAIDRALDRAVAAQRLWRGVTLAERMAISARFVDAFAASGEAIAAELTAQMGRPIGQTPGEIRGFADRGRAMIALAEEALTPVRPEPIAGFERFVRREPLGVVYVIGAWNYPYLITVNSVVPALLAGNAVVLKQAPQTLLCAERFAEAFAEAGLPEGVFQYLHMSNENAEAVIGDRRVDFIAFTGSVATGHRVVQAASHRFAGVGLELGGKDPAYVRRDADLDHAVANLVDGAFFNSGQSCCAIERIYVDAAIHDAFVERFAALTRQYRLGNPLDAETTLGPLVDARAADFVRGQIAEATARGARALIDEKAFAASVPGTPYLAPQVLIGVDHEMDVMRRESFGPVVGIMKVASDREALALMNDSPYGLTASLWTQDVEAARSLGDAIDTGTVFMNRCDYLDPLLAWVGAKESGRGCTLSRIGFEHLTRPKSFHLRTAA
ncbi:aldehyde dehydrogenase family protein [Acidiphilium sp. AL]|uniref:aldehyde dehydrogenase family protein n=1 Tax=Acidiphilium sp. AL TaxID=2871704 RepID=UPI0021CB6FC9|nr:aldehyde dehydrogenase family protein [Acidiphilium sp. AL]MCU4161080.1 aldehyde dehydrogenase family protein [Acidiphilium sp. AL]